MSTATDRAAWYTDCRQQLEQELQPKHTAFPVQIELAGHSYSFSIWRGQQLPDRLLAYDCETVAIESTQIPQLALATVYGDQGSGCFIHPQDLSRFIRLHADRFYACHNATFDFWVTAAALQTDPAACGLWWDVAGSRLYCTMLGDALIRLARIDAEPISRDLATVAKQYCPGVQLDKSDPFRLRYAELIGLPASAWADTAPGFWRYAAADPVATLLVAQRQFAIAAELIQPYRSELLPDAVRRFGPLSACLQAAGSIALDYASRTGVHVDLTKAHQLKYAIAERIEQHQREMEQLLPGCFKRYGPRSKKAGQLQLTDAGVPRRDAKLIKQRLEHIAQASDEPIRPAKLKDGSCTDAVRYWKQHSNLHPFISAFVGFSEQAKLSQFFGKLDQSTIYPRYSH